MIHALVPAAGHSTRMGRPKLSLPLGDRTVIEQVVRTLREAIDQVLVVVGPHVAELVPLAEKAGAATLLLEHETPDMRATIERGLAWIETRHHPTSADFVLLVPADHPALDAQVIRNLLAVDSPRDIRIPTFQGKRGHPTLIGWRHVAAIRALPSNAGLNTYLRSVPAEVLEVPVDFASILLDLDTPEDYAKICAPRVPS